MHDFNLAEPVLVHRQLNEDKDAGLAALNPFHSAAVLFA